VHEKVKEKGGGAISMEYMDQSNSLALLATIWQFA